MKSRTLVLLLGAAWLAAGNKPQPVPATGLELRLRLDEGQGDVLKNSAPDAKVAAFKADTNPLIWGENTWFWPSMRMDILSRINQDKYAALARLYRGVSLMTGLLTATLLTVAAFHLTR